MGCSSGLHNLLEQLCIYVAFHAFLEHCNWLEVGFLLWRQMGLDSSTAERDFFLTRPNKSLSGCVLAMARYADASAMSLALAKRGVSRTLRTLS